MRRGSGRSESLCLWKRKIARQQICPSGPTRAIPGRHDIAYLIPAIPIPTSNHGGGELICGRLCEVLVSGVQDAIHRKKARGNQDWLGRTMRAGGLCKPHDKWYSAWSRVTGKENSFGAQTGQQTRLFTGCDQARPHHNLIVHDFSCVLLTGRQGFLANYGAVNKHFSSCSRKYTARPGIGAIDDQCLVDAHIYARAEEKSRAMTFSIVHFGQWVVRL